MWSVITLSTFGLILSGKICCTAVTSIANMIGNQGAEMLSEFLKSNTLLQHLDLQGIQSCDALVIFLQQTKLEMMELQSLQRRWKWTLPYNMCTVCNSTNTCLGCNGYDIHFITSNALAFLMILPAHQLQAVEAQQLRQLQVTASATSTALQSTASTTSGGSTATMSTTSTATTSTASTALQSTTSDGTST